MPQMRPRVVSAHAGGAALLPALQKPVLGYPAQEKAGGEIAVAGTCWTESEYRKRQRSSRREAIIMGAWLGAAAAILFAIIAGAGLDWWRVQNHERLTREAVATVDARLAECQGITERVAGQNYSEVLRMARQIDARGRR